MTLTQTVEISADRRVHLNFEVPREIPTGRANVEMKVIPFEKKTDKPVIRNDLSALKGKIGMTKKELDDFLENAKTPITDSLTGILSDMGEVDLDTMRLERMAKHL